LNDAIAMTHSGLVLLLAIGLRPASIRELEAGRTFVANDPEPEVVRRFFAEARLPYDRTFVSIGCFREAGGLEKLAKYFAQPGGKVAVLNRERVLDDIKVAAHHDIQELARRGADAGQALECARCFLWPSHERTIEQALLCAADRATQYAEARIFRPLVRADISHYVNH
jgi:hypothetical protein